MSLFRKKPKQLNSKTPPWFKDWHSEFFCPVKSKTQSNEKLIFVILAASLANVAIINNPAQAMEFVHKIVSLVGG